MKVTITHSEIQAKVGLFRKDTFHEVNTLVEFTAEELEVIHHRKLQDVIVLDREPHAQARRNLTQDRLDTFGDFFKLKISNLMKGTDSYSCESPIAAKQYDAELREGLRNLKGYLDANATPIRGSDTFEL